MVDVGLRLRRVRESYGLTQRALATKSGINNSTISLIEQNKISPSVGVLKRILEGIPLSLSAFFADDTPFDTGKVFYRRDELTRISINDSFSVMQVGGDLTGRALQIMHEQYHPGADTGTELLTHEAEEGGVVTRGRIELTVAGRSRILEVGDAYYFDSRLPHRFRNAHDGESELISACSPPSF